MLNSNDGSLLSTFHQFYIPNNNGLYSSSAMKSYDLNTQTIQLLDPFNLHSKITTAVVCCNSTIHLLEMKEITPNTAVVSGNNTNNHSSPYEWIEKNRFEIPQDHSSHASSSHTQTFKILLDREYGHVIVCSHPALVVSLQTGQVVARLRMNAHNGCLDEMHGVAFFNIDHKTIHVYD